ncbi:MAG TPA: TetR family transcriptional regulator [Marmoricola sp.]|nr:TetR family transcriptional regulator [Marmoricola sp.]
MTDTPRGGRSSQAATREKLTRAAAELIAELGWGRVTTRAVAERAGVPHGAVSYHFNGKQDLLIESCLAAFADAVSLEEYAAQATIEDIVTLIGAEVGQGLEAHAVLGRLMFEAMREAERDEALRERLQAMIGQYREVLVAVVRAEQERGRVPATVSAEGIATLVTAVGDGLYLHALIDRDLPVDEALDALRALLAAR